jgi:hypothetical protein
MERTNFVEHKGKKILHLNFSNCKDPQVLLTAIAYAKSFVAKNPPKSLLCLTDVSDSIFPSELVDAMKNLAKDNAPYVKASALLGITGMKKYILNAAMQFSGRKLVAFEDMQSAKDWLISQS